jgi:hypothetical protein
VTLDRDTFRKVDRKLASELDQKEGSRLLRIPVSDATWSAWQRYCQALRIPMGRAASLLIENELRALVGEERDPVTIAEVEGEVARRRAAIEERERRVDERERTIARRSAPLSSSETDRVERNDRCPCGSGLKYKRCHGMWSGSVGVGS